MSNQEETANLDKSVSELEGKALIQRIEQYFQNAYIARRDAEARWLTTMAMLEGYHYYRFDYQTRKVYIEKTTPPGQVRAKIDDILMRYEEALGRFSTAPILPTVLPRNNNVMVWMKVKPTQMLVDYFRTKESLGFQRSYTNLVKYLLGAGTGALYVGWNAQEEMPYIEAVPPWELFPFPASATDDKKLNGIIRATIVDKEWVKTYFPEVSDTKAPRTFQDSVNGYGAYGGRGLTTEGYMVKYVFFKPSAAFPKGRLVILVEDKIVRDLRQLPGGVFPLFICRYTPMMNFWWGIPLLYRVANMNREMNRLFSALIASSKMIANGGYIFFPSGAIDVQQVHKQQGAFIPYTPQTAFDNNTDFKYFQAPKAGTELNLMLQTVKGFVDDLTSQHDISRGQAEGRVDSATGLSFLRDEDMTPLATVSEDLKTVYADVFSLVIKLCKENWTTAKRISILDENDIPFDMALQNNMLADDDEVEVNVAPIMPQSKQFLMEKLDQLFQQQQITPTQYKKGLLALGFRLPGMEALSSPDEKNALLEIKLIFNDGQQPGQVPETLPQEDHQEHMRIHRDFMASFEFSLFASQDVIEAFEQHLATHQQMIQGLDPNTASGLPPQTDTEMEEYDGYIGALKIGQLELDDLLDRLPSIAEDKLEQEAQYGKGGQETEKKQELQKMVVD